MAPAPVGPNTAVSRAALLQTDGSVQFALVVSHVLLPAALVHRFSAAKEGATSPQINAAKTQGDKIIRCINAITALAKARRSDN